jgi:hypothetical protein
MRWALFLLIGGVYSVYSAPSGGKLDWLEINYSIFQWNAMPPINTINALAPANVFR